MSGKGFTTWEELETSAYMMFRMSEAEHVAKTYHNQCWAATEYERHALDAYDRALVPNSMGWSEW